MRRSQLAVHDLGGSRGPVLVLFHGNGDSGMCWPDAAVRWTNDFWVLGADARGHGDSPEFKTGQLERAGDVFADDAERVLEEAAARAVGAPVIGIGHSLGGGSLTTVMARRSDLLDAAVLIDPPWDTPPVEGARPDVGAARVEFIRECQRDPKLALREHRLSNPTWPESEHEAWLEAKMHLDLAYIATGSGRPSTPWMDMVDAIRTPTLVVTGDPGECLVGVATQAVLSEMANPSIMVSTVTGANHYVRQSATAAFHAVVDPWLRGTIVRPNAGLEDHVSL